jgi:hypothetical protein
MTARACQSGNLGQFDFGVCPCSPFPGPFPQKRIGELKASVEQRERVFLAARTVLKPVADNRQMEKAEGVSAKIADLRNFIPFFGVLQDLLNEPQVAEIQFLSLKAQQI